MLRLAPVAALMACSLGAVAQTAPTPATTATVQTTTAGEPGSPNLRVHEDNQVRIEELQVRGQTERVTVRHKHTGLLGGLPRDYEIVTSGRGRDPSDKRAAVGQRVWSVFSF